MHFLVLVQVHQRAGEKWKDADPRIRSLRKSLISNMLKVECCVNAAHSLDDLSLEAYGLYQTLPGLDCTFPGLVFAMFISSTDVIFSVYTNTFAKFSKVCHYWHVPFSSSI